MKNVRTLSTATLALAVSLVLLAPAPAFGQHVKVFDGRGYGYLIPAAPGQEIRVTVGNPFVVDPNDPDAHAVPFYLKLQGVDGEATHTIEPGAAYTFTIDPRTASVAPPQHSTVRTVTVSFSTVVEIDEGSPSPQA